MIMQILDHLPGFTRWGLYGISSDWKGDGDRARQGHTGRGLCWPEVFLRGGNRSPAGAALRPHRLSAPRAPGNAAALAPRAARALRPAAPIRPASAAEPGIGPGGRRRLCGGRAPQGPRPRHRLLAGSWPRRTRHGSQSVPGDAPG